MHSKIWSSEKMSQELKQGTIVPIYKNGKNNTCTNYWGLSYILLKKARSVYGRSSHIV